MARYICFLSSSTAQPSPPAPTPCVSFVVIAYNEEASIAAALSSILSQGGGTREVIVIDDGSTDDTLRVATAVSEIHPEVRVRRLAPNRGRGFARATGVREAAGRYIATVDADIVLPDDWLTRCLEAIQGADAVAGTALPDGDVAYLFSRFRLEPKHVGHTAEVTGSNALYRHEVFDTVSFDPQLREGEDVALNHSLRQRGVRLLTIPGLVVRHAESKNLRQGLSWMFQSGRGASRQFGRYRQIRIPDVVFAGWLVSLGGVLRPRSLGLPVLYLGVAASAHVARAFVCKPRQPGVLLAAVTVDMGMLSAYFAGRLAGAVSAVARDPAAGTRSRR